MFIAQVKGNVVATQKVSDVAGRKLLIVEPYVLDQEPKPGLKPTGRAIVVIDTVGAGEGEYVLITQGSSARMTDITQNMPVDAVIIGIIDKIMLADQIAYEK
jgi:ethanolamine utilization protein EutN